MACLKYFNNVIMNIMIITKLGVQAIQEFGPAKGGILTAWRLLRCSPFGGRGYDPPKWPPVPYNYGSY